MTQQPDPAKVSPPDRPQPPASASVDHPQPTASAAPVPVPIAPKKRGLLDYVLAGALVLAIGGVAFAAGRLTAPAAAAGGGPGTGGFVPVGPGASGDPGTGGFVPPDGSFDPGAGGFGPGGGRGGFGGGLSIEGVVTSVDGSSLVIETTDGTQTTVTLDGDTTYHASTATDAGQVATGDDVTVRVSGGGFGGGVPGGNGGGGGSGDTPSFTATDVTVQR
jgi:hypothetical protein